MLDDDHLIDQLKGQMDGIRERIRQLGELLVPSRVTIPPQWRLTAAKAWVFAQLTTRDECTKNSIMAAMYAGRTGSTSWAISIRPNMSRSGVS